MAAVCTSRMSAPSTTMSVWPRRPASVRAACTAPADSTAPTGSRPSVTYRRSLRMSSSMPSLVAARRASAARRATAASRPSDPSAGSHEVSRVRTRRRRPSPIPARPPTNMCCSEGRSATNGEGSRSVRPCGGRGARSGARRPRSTVRSITMRSRSGSMAGLVTWAKLWRRWSATGRSRCDVARRRRVVAHAPERLVRLEGHGLDVQPLPLGIEAGDPAGGQRACASLAPRSAARQDPSGHPGGVTTWRRLSARTVERAASSRAWRSWRMTWRSTSTTMISPGPRRRRSTVSAASMGMAPPSEAAATRPDAVTVTESGRRPLRSSMAPTRVPSLKHSAAGPSQGASKPGGAPSECVQLGHHVRAQAGGVGDGHQQRRVQAPAGSHEELERLVQGQRVGRPLDRAGDRAPRGARRCGHRAWPAGPGPVPGCRGRC